VSKRQEEACKAGPVTKGGLGGDAVARFSRGASSMKGTVGGLLGTICLQACAVPKAEHEKWPAFQVQY
jgi:hypothetical protein